MPCKKKLPSHVFDWYNKGSFCMKMCRLPNCFKCSYQLPAQVQYVPVVVVFYLIAWLYSSFCFHAIPLLYDPITLRPYWLPIAVFFSLTTLLFVSLGKCLTCGQNHLIRQKHNTQTKTVLERKENGDKRFCRKCDCFKPDRAHHCSTCNTCVLKMDHHCVFLNKCIGFYNYKFFLLFLLWSSLSCLFISYTLLAYNSLALVHFQKAMKLFKFGRLSFFNSSFQICAVFFLCLCVGVAIFLFMLMHLFLAIQNYTTLEYCEKRRSTDYINYYNMGIRSNLAAIFGGKQEFMIWFLPVQHTQMKLTQGRHFPHNKQFHSKNK